MAVLHSILTVIAIVLVGLIAGVDFFCAVVLRAMARTLNDPLLVTVMGTIHRYGDRRLMWPALLSIAATVLTAIASVISGAGAIAVSADAVAGLAVLVWLATFARVSAPINATLSAAASGGPAVADPRSEQDRWDGVITARAVLLIVALAGLAVGAVSA